MVTSQDYMTRTVVNKSFLDSYAFIWLERIQGIYKSKQVIKKLKQWPTFLRQTKQESL